MKPESGINNRWKLLDGVLGIDCLKYKFDAYSWYQNQHVRISKNEYWSGWWNDCFNFVSIYPRTYHGKTMLKSVTEVFEKSGYTISPIVNGGISITYRTMTQQESDERAKRNLLSGGRMSD